MDHIGAHLFKKSAVEQERDRRTERGELLKEFLAKLNAPRRRDGWPPLTIARLGVTLQGIPTQDLYYLKKVCDRAHDFSKKFWWEINPKNHEGTKDEVKKAKAKAYRLKKKQTDAKSKKNEAKSKSVKKDAEAQ